MRWSHVAITLLLGCSSSAAQPEDADAGTRSCAKTSCVAGASCVTADGTLCRCFEAGAWSCGGAAGEPQYDGGFTLDSGGSADARPAPDTPTGPFTRAADVCSSAGIDACTGEDPIEGARAKLTTLMRNCAASCTSLTLYASDGCATQFVANVEWSPGALDCLARVVSAYRWPCLSELSAMTTGCPE